jgi:hypothetical protein
MKLLIIDSEITLIKKNFFDSNNSINSDSVCFLHDIKNLSIEYNNNNVAFDTRYTENHKVTLLPPNWDKLEYTEFGVKCTINTYDVPILARLDFKIDNSENLSNMIRNNINKLYKVSKEDTEQYIKYDCFDRSGSIVSRVIFNNIIIKDNYNLWPSPSSKENPISSILFSCNSFECQSIIL